jgi:hypothetical protein
MSALIFSVFVVGCFIVVGYPWLTSQWKGTDIKGVIIASCFFGYLAVAIAGTWSVGLIGNEGLSIVISLFCGSALACVFKVRRKTRPPLLGDTRLASGLIALTISVLLIVGISILQQGGFGVGIRIGPDAIGNAIASDEISGKTVTEIEQTLIATSNKSLNELFSTDKRLLYKLPHLRDQVAGEFLIAGLRWGLPSTVAAIQTLPKAVDVYQNLELLAIFALCLTAHLLYFGLRLIKTPRLLAGLFAIASSITTPLLAGWREGGYSQIYALPAFVFVIGTWTLGDIKRSKPRMDTVAALAACLVIYSDMFILAIAIAVLALVLQLGNFETQIILLRRYLTDIAAALVLVLPYSLRFVSYLPRRLEDSSIGGWSLPHWPNVAELLGIVNGFNQTAPSGLIDRSEVLSIIGTTLTPVLVAVWTVTLVRFRVNLMVTMFNAISLVLTLVYIKARYIDDATNYQVFKAAGCLAPILLIGGYACIQSHLVSRIAGSKTTKYLIVATSACLIISSLNYQTKFSSQSVLVNKVTLGKPKNSIFDKSLSEVNLIGPSTLEFTAINALNRFAWYGRASFGLMEFADLRKDYPLYLVISNQFCALQCKGGLETGRFEKFGEAFVVIPLAKDSEILTTLEVTTFSKGDLVARVNQYLLSMNLPQLDINFNPTMRI